MRTWIRWMTLLGVALGSAVILFGLARFLASGSVISLLTALAVGIAGPLEDLWKDWAARRAPGDVEKAEWTLLIDRITSVAFLLVLAVVIALAH